jgi:hypothetical protein
MDERDTSALGPDGSHARTPLLIVAVAASPQYTSRAAQLYRAMLEKEAAKVTPAVALQTATSVGCVLPFTGRC